MMKKCPVPLDGRRRLCHDGEVVKLEFQIPCPRQLVTDRDGAEMESKSLKTSDSRAVKINFGTLGESEWEEELSMAAMRQF